MTEMYCFLIFVLVAVVLALVAVTGAGLAICLTVVCVGVICLRLAIYGSIILLNFSEFFLKQVSSHTHRTCLDGKCCGDEQCYKM